MTYSAYDGHRGDDYAVTQQYTDRDAQGNLVTRTRTVIHTRWTAVSGEVQHFFDDVLVTGTRSLPDDLVYELVPWDLNKLVRFKPEYLSGFKTERYAVGLEEGFGRAKPYMRQTIHQICLLEIGGDHQRLDSVRTQYLGVTFKHVLLPVWVASYRYHDQLFQILINARTGEVAGRRPYSVAKIVSLVVALAILALALFFLVARANAAGSAGPGVRGDDGLRRPQPVHGGADDAAGVPGPFADRVQSLHPRRDARLRVAHDPHGRAAAGFRADQDGVREEPAAPPPVHPRQPLGHGRGHGRRQDGPQVGRHHAPRVARRRPRSPPAAL
jgi:hypothetical protein